MQFIKDQRGERLLRLSRGDADTETVKKRINEAEKKKILQRQEEERRRLKSQQDIQKMFEKGLLSLAHIFGVIQFSILLN